MAWQANLVKKNISSSASATFALLDFIQAGASQNNYKPQIILLYILICIPDLKPKHV